MFFQKANMSTDFFFYYQTEDAALTYSHVIVDALGDEFDVKMGQNDDEYVVVVSIEKVLTDDELDVITPVLSRIPGYDGWGQDVKAANSE